LFVRCERIPESQRCGNSEKGQVLEAVVCKAVSMTIPCACHGVSCNILMPNKPVRTRAANSRTKPTVNCCSLEMVGEKGWLAEASQSV
jgi:hypothetical protein